MMNDSDTMCDAYERMRGKVLARVCEACGHVVAEYHGSWTDACGGCGRPTGGHIIGARLYPKKVLVIGGERLFRVTVDTDAGRRVIGGGLDYTSPPGTVFVWKERSCSGV